jgi:hypothetical protein
MSPASPTGRRLRDSRRNDDETLFDPFWEFILGDEGVEVEKSRKFFSQPSSPERSDSFLEYLFPEEEMTKTSRSSQPKQDQELHASASVAPEWLASDSGKSRKTGFWRRKKSKSVPSSSASWFSEDRNERSTSRDGGRLFRRSKPKSDPFGITSAKNSFDSFIDYYYNSDVSTSEEEVVVVKKQRKKKQPAAPRKFPLSSSKKTKDDSDSYLSSYLSWDANGKKQKSRRFFNKKEKKQTGSGMSSLLPAAATAAIAATGLAATNSKSSSGGTLGRSRASSPASSTRKKREEEMKRPRSERDMSPFEQLVESLDVFGDNVSTSEEEDEEYTSSGSSGEDGSSFESSFASTSFSYATEVTEEDTNYTPTKSLANARSYNQNRALPKTPTGAKNRNSKDVNEVRLKYSPSKKRMTELTRKRALLPPLDNRDEEGEEESSSPSGILAGESVVSRSFESSTQYEDDEETLDERDDSITVSTKETAPPVSDSRPFSEPLSYGLPAVLPKSKSRTMLADTTKEEESVIERSRLILAQNSQSLHVGRVICCSIKDLPPVQQQRAKELGVPVHELSREELEEIFPKVRSISEEVPLSRHRSAVIGNSKSFEKNFPAHLQAIVNQNGPQSLFEYEYEKGTHKVLVYEAFGPSPRDLLRVHISDKPPVLFREGFLDDDKVIVQVEVS